MFLLPSAPHQELYYASLNRELVTISPQTFAPAIGKSVRRLYAALGTGLVEAEVGRRLANWFSSHLSNFSFGWAWKEWATDMSLDPAHPRRAFVRSLVDLCVRLSYYDRIKSVIPAELQAGALAAQEPGPDFGYAQPGELLTSDR